MKKIIFTVFVLNIWVVWLGLITAGTVQAYWFEVKNNLPASDNVKAAAHGTVTFIPGGALTEWAAPGETKSFNYGGANIGLCFTSLVVTFNKGFPGCGEYISHPGYNGIWCQNMTLEVTRKGCDAKVKLIGRGW